MSDSPEKSKPVDDPTYSTLLALEDLESLLEELEESMFPDGEGQIPELLRKQMVELGVSDVAQVRQRIVQLHHELDAAE